MTAGVLETYDPRTAPGVSRLSQFGPILIAVATVAIALGCAFGIVPGGNLATGLAILGGHGAAILAQKIGN